MECTESKRDSLESTVVEVRDASYYEKTSNHDLVNSVLDKILEIKAIINKKSDQVEDLVEKIERITWKDLSRSEASLRTINDLVAAVNDYRHSLKKNYGNFGIVNGTNYATEERERFLESLDDLKEVCRDLESIYFDLPNDTSFTETTRLLALV